MSLTITTDGDFFSRACKFAVYHAPPVPYDALSAALRRRIDGITTDDEAIKEIEEINNADHRYLPSYLLRSLLKSFTSIDDFKRDANATAALIRSYMGRSRYTVCIMDSLITESRACPAVSEALCDIVGVCVNVGFVSTRHLLDWWSSPHNNARPDEKDAVEKHLDDGSLMDMWNESDEKSRAKLEPTMIRLRARRGIGVGVLR